MSSLKRKNLEGLSFEELNSKELQTEKDREIHGESYREGFTKELNSLQYSLGYKGVPYNGST